jgi:hypothetical protein
LLLALLLTDRLARLFRLLLNRLPIFDLIDFRLKALREELGLWFETIPLAENAGFSKRALSLASLRSAANVRTASTEPQPTSGGDKKHAQRATRRR